MKGKIFVSGLLLIAALSLFSCGGGGSGGGGDVVTTFDTVTISAAPVTVFGATIPIGTPADLLPTGAPDGLSGCADPTQSDFTFDDTFQNFLITSGTISNLSSSVTPSDVRVDQVTITFSPNPVTAPEVQAPAITTVTIVPLGGQLVKANGTLQLNIPLISQAIKQNLALNNISTLLCAVPPATFKYTATLKFDGTEVLTNKKGSWSTTFQVYFTTP